MAASVILFDLDGTIWNSYPWYSKVLAEEGLVPEEYSLNKLRQGESIVKLLNQYGVSRSRLRMHYSEIELYADVHQTLAKLMQIGKPMGIVTNLPGWMVKPMLDQLGLSAFFGTGIYAARKPQPDSLLTALQQLEVNIDTSAFYVGDRDIDAEAALNAGLSFAWAAYGYGVTCPPTAIARLDRFRDVLGL